MHTVKETNAEAGTDKRRLGQRKQVRRRICSNVYTDIIAGKLTCDALE